MTGDDPVTQAPCDITKPHPGHDWFLPQPSMMAATERRYCDGIPYPDVTINGADLARLFDLATDSPLVCSGSFETDDVDLLRRIAVDLGTDPEDITPDEFITNYPHRFKPVRVAQSPIWLNGVTHHLGAGYGTESRLETQAEFAARLAAGPPDTCQAGTYRRECGRPAADERHTK